MVWTTCAFALFGACYSPLHSIACRTHVVYSDDDDAEEDGDSDEDDAGDDEAGEEREVAGAGRQDVLDHQQVHHLGQQHCDRHRHLPTANHSRPSTPANSQSQPAIDTCQRLRMKFPKVYPHVLGGHDPYLHCIHAGVNKLRCLGRPQEVCRSNPGGCGVFMIFTYAIFQLEVIH